MDDSPPPRVRTAVGLVLATVLLVPAYPLLFGSGDVSSGVLRADAVVMSLMLLHVWALWRRQNWARILFVVLVLAAIPGLFVHGPDRPLPGTTQQAVGLVQVLVSGSAAVLLSTGAASVWYAQVAGDKAQRDRTRYLLVFLIWVLVLPVACAVLGFAFLQTPLHDGSDVPPTRWFLATGAAAVVAASLAALLLNVLLKRRSVDDSAGEGHR